MVSRKEVKEAINNIHENGVRKVDLYAEYNKRKLHVQLLETQNDSQIIVFPSVDAPWYKIGWNSALFYAYDVGIRANDRNGQPVIRTDTDHATRSREGIVFVRDIDKMIKKLSEIGYTKYEKTRDGIYIFELGKAYTKSEIKEFKNTYYRKNEELFNMVARKKVYPELRGLIVKAMTIIFPKSKKMPAFYQQSIGLKMTDAIIEMNNAYFDFVNKRLDAKVALTKIVTNVNSILACLTVLSELGVWSPIELTEAGSVMVDIKMSVARIIKKGKDDVRT